MQRWKEEFIVQAHRKRVHVHHNGDFEHGKVLYMEPEWSYAEFLSAASNRLEMGNTAKRVFNADGVEIDDCMMIEDEDILFLSVHDNFIAPADFEIHNDVNTSGRKEEKIPHSVGGYRVTELLGRGGFGEVRIGEHQLTGERVALKFLRKSEILSLGAAERTNTEIQCLTALRHNNIIRLQQHLESQFHVVLVFELMEGGDLLKYLVRKKRLGSTKACLSEDETRHVFYQVLSAVSYAHNQHICHRDLKLENILLKDSSIAAVKIADFGLSDFYRPGAVMKSNCGTLSFLAPEVFKGTANAGPPLDVWSMGVILFALVSGRLPFEGSDLVNPKRPRDAVIKAKIMKCQYKLDELLSCECKDLIRRMLQPDPNERMTIPEIFNHIWIRSMPASIPISPLPDISPYQFNHFQQQVPPLVNVPGNFSPMMSPAQQQRKHSPVPSDTLLPKVISSPVLNNSNSSSHANASTAFITITSRKPKRTNSSNTLEGSANDHCLLTDRSNSSGISQVGDLAAGASPSSSAKYSQTNINAPDNTILPSKPSKVMFVEDPLEKLKRDLSKENSMNPAYISSSGSTSQSVMDRGSGIEEGTALPELISPDIAQHSTVVAQHSLNEYERISFANSEIGTSQIVKEESKSTIKLVPLRRAASKDNRLLDDDSGDLNGDAIRTLHSDDGAPMRPMTVIGNGSSSLGKRDHRRDNANDDDSVSFMVTPSPMTTKKYFGSSKDIIRTPHTIVTSPTHALKDRDSLQPLVSPANRPPTAVNFDHSDVMSPPRRTGAVLDPMINSPTVSAKPHPPSANARRSDLHYNAERRHTTFMAATAILQPNKVHNLSNPPSTVVVPVPTVNSTLYEPTASTMNGNLASLRARSQSNGSASVSVANNIHSSRPRFMS